MQLRWWALSVMLFCGALKAHAAENSLAVMPINAAELQNRLPRNALNALEDAMREDIEQALPSDRWKVFSSRETLRAMIEAGFEPSDCVDSTCHQITARGLGATRYLTWALHPAGGDLLLELAVFETREGRRLFNDQVSASQQQLRAALAKRLTEFFQRAGLLRIQEPPKPVAKPKVTIRKFFVDKRSGLEFAYIEGGPFTAGCEAKDEQCFADEQETHEVVLNPFWLGRVEVPINAYEKCVRVGACSPPVSNGLGADRCNWNRRPDHPTNCVTFEGARQFCQWLGGDLPTADEWEFAAKDGGGRIYPWGNEEPTPDRAVVLAEDTNLPGRLTKGASPAGVYDLVGNVAEWTSTPSVLHAQMQVRGGAFNSGARWLRPSARASAPTEQGQDSIGFRCRLPVKP